MQIFDSGACPGESHRDRSNVPARALDSCFAYLDEGREEDAIRELEKAQRLSWGAPHFRGGFGSALARTGNADAARKILGELEAISTTSYVSPVVFSWVHTGLGENDDAMRWLHKAYDERATLLVSLKTFPVFDPLRSGPDSRSWSAA